MGVLNVSQPHISSQSGNLPPIINDFSINIATVNGTGSQTANLAILRALFNMGIPVSGKNIFPSNIQGLPTWYQIRVSKDGYTARCDNHEILVAFNATTIHQDVQALEKGDVCLYNADIRDIPIKDNIITYGIPVTSFLKSADISRSLKDYLANMVYVGVLAQLIDIQTSAIEKALHTHFKGRQSLVDSNMDIVKAAYKWTTDNIIKSDPYCVAPMNENAGKIIMTGNQAAALGAVFGGVSFVSWYPITPSTSLIDSLNEYLPRLRQDPETGKATYAIIQAEDELAAIGMVIGAGWAGARAMTATSGPGLSLMAEFAGLAYYAEIPSVIWDVQRVGPSTGLPTRTAQGDITFAYYLGHGDTKNIILLPATVAECFEFGTVALNLADELQTLVLVLSDLDLGMNHWVSEPFDYPSEPIKRGKILKAEEINKKGFFRYKDIDGDGISYRTLPGNENPLSAWFARGTGHNTAAIYSERPEDWVENMERLLRKFNTARNLVPAPVVDENPHADFAIISYGTTLSAIEEVRDYLSNQKGIETSFLRLRALPIHETTISFVTRYEKVCVIEMNRDGQVCTILQTEMPALSTRFYSIAYMDGNPLTTQKILDLLQQKGMV